MIVSKKLNTSELNALIWTLTKLEQDNMLEVLDTSYIYINRHN